MNSWLAEKFDIPNNLLDFTSKLYKVVEGSIVLNSEYDVEERKLFPIRVSKW